MAKVAFSSLVTDARGKIAGNVFSKNRGGNYVRQRVAGFNPQTARQTSQRSILAVVSAAWKGLTDAQRALWFIYAADHPFTNVFGDSHILAGNAAYTGLNSFRLTLNIGNSASIPATQTTIASPPAVVSVYPAAALSATGVGATNVITITTAAQSVTTGFYFVLATPGLSPGAKPQASQYRAAASQKTIAAATTVVTTPSTLNPLLAFAAADRVGLLVARSNVNGEILDVTPLEFIAS